MSPFPYVSMSLNVCVCTSLSAFEYILPMKTCRFLQNNVWVLNFRNEKVYTTKHTLLHTTGIKVFLCMKKKNASQQMFERDLRMLLSGLEMNGPCWYLFM